MTRQRFTLGSTRYQGSSPEDAPLVKISLAKITGSWVGGLLTIGLGIYLWMAIPAFRYFLVGALALGVLIGLALWLKHR